MLSLFANMATFNANIIGQGVSSVPAMDRMFYGVTSFGPDLSLWNVVTAAGMFVGAEALNINRMVVERN